MQAASRSCKPIVSLAASRKIRSSSLNTQIHKRLKEIEEIRSTEEENKLVVPRRSRCSRNEVEGTTEKELLRRNGADKMVRLTKQTKGLALEVEARGNRLEEEVGAFEMGLGMVDVVGVVEK